MNAFFPIAHLDVLMGQLLDGDELGNEKIIFCPEKEPLLTALILRVCCIKTRDYPSSRMAL